MPSQRGTVSGRGHSRGDQPGHGQHHPTSDTPRDVTDPSNIWLTPEQYSQLSPEQHRAGYERLQASCATTSAQTHNVPPVPGIVQANATSVDNQSVLSTPSAAPTAPATQPGTVLRSMMSNANSRASPSPSASSSTSAAPTNDSITINGVMYTRHVNATSVYRLHETDARLHPTGALVDGGAMAALPALICISLSPTSMLLLMFMALLIPSNLYPSSKLLPRLIPTMMALSLVSSLIMPNVLMMDQQDIQRAKWSHLASSLMTSLTSLVTPNIL